MLVTITNLFHRAKTCPFACLLKFLLCVSFIYALHVAAYHQTDVSPYSYVWLVDSVGIIGILALASHFNCQFRDSEEKGEND
jgi:hypothetical protein